ncbi:four helix bundle protein [Candidatus Shapirobacteria bacterium]|nr:four helix bundle protein [Candidatus Shapirobacteria bacterium]
MQNEKEKFKKEFISRLIRFSIRTIRFAEELRKERSIWPIIVDQLVRAVTSIGANVVEAKSSSLKKDYIKFFEIALKSANEAKYWYLLIREAVENVELKRKADELLSEADEISKILGSSILTLKGKK